MSRVTDAFAAADRILRGAEEDVFRAEAILANFTRTGHQPAIEAAVRNLDAHVRFREQARRAVRKLEAQQEAAG